MAKDKARLQANGNNNAFDARPKGGPTPAARMTKYGRPLSFFILFLPFCALVARYSAISHCTYTRGIRPHFVVLEPTC